jgi:hypothetical protein
MFIAMNHFVLQFLLVAIALLAFCSGLWCLGQDLAVFYASFMSLGFVLLMLQDVICNRRFRWKIAVVYIGGILMACSFMY